MNIYKFFQASLEALGCLWSESRGIVTVRTPDGTVWDFTVPMKRMRNEC